MTELLRSLRSLWYWLPVVWRDRHWDYHFLYVILRHKLTGMYKALSNSNGIGANKQAKHIKYAIYLLDRLIRDDVYGEYRNTAFKEHDRKWGELDVSLNDDGTLKFSRPNVLTEDDAVQERKEYRRCMRLSDYLEKQDLEQLFGIMMKYMRYWWI